MLVCGAFFPICRYAIAALTRTNTTIMMKNRPPLRFSQIQASERDAIKHLRRHLATANYFEAYGLASSILDMYRAAYAQERRLFGTSWARAGYDRHLKRWNGICRRIKKASDMLTAS